MAANHSASRLRSSDRRLTIARSTGLASQSIGRSPPNGARYLASNWQVNYRLLYYRLQKPRQTLDRFLRNGSERLDDDELSDLFTLKKETRLSTSMLPTLKDELDGFNPLLCKDFSLKRLS